MYVSPFSTLTKIDWPTGKGIYCLPHDTDNPRGWGEPRKDAKGNPITPGTPGGSSPYVYVRRQQDKLKSFANPTFQKSGNITWWGKQINADKPTQGRYVLSYFGPTTRYFPDGQFIYGSSGEHNAIFMNGAYAAVAPGPVLGAALRDVADMAGKKTRWLYVVTWEGKDRIYRKKLSGLIAASKMTDAIRKAQMGAYHEKDNPAGWEFLTEFPKVDGAYDADRPWFFNESGTAAACMRLHDKEFDNGGGTITEQVLYQYGIDLANEVAPTWNPPLEPSTPLAYSEHFYKSQQNYVQNDAAGYPHTWLEDNFNLTVRLNGTQKVLVDYVGDTLHSGHIKYRMFYYNAQYWTKGIDPSPYNDAGGNNISNVGKPWPNYPTPRPTPEEQGDHYPSIWYGRSGEINLHYGPDSASIESRPYIALHQTSSGTSDEWEGHPRQSTNPYLYYVFIATRYIRGLLDIRNLAVLALDHARSFTGSGSPVDRTENWGYYVYSSENLEGQGLAAYRKTSSVPNPMGWTRTTMETWTPVNFDITSNRTTYVGTWPTFNETGQTRTPGSRDNGFITSPKDYYEKWPTITELQLANPFGTLAGNGVRTDRSELALSMTVPNPETDSTEELNYVLTPNETTSLPGLLGYGRQFYPIGAC